MFEDKISFSFEEWDFDLGIVEPIVKEKIASDITSYFQNGGRERPYPTFEAQEDGKVYVSVGWWAFGEIETYYLFDDMLSRTLLYCDPKEIEDTGQSLAIAEAFERAAKAIREEYAKHRKAG